jgi:hypothetical protein
MHDMQEDFLRAAGSNRGVAARAKCKKGKIIPKLAKVVPNCKKSSTK